MRSFEIVGEMTSVETIATDNAIRNSESDDTRVTRISQAHTLEEIAEFWDSHNLADYWDQTCEVEFQVRAQHRRRITLDPDVYVQIEAQAHVRGLQPETLVNLWLAERLQEVGKS